MGSVQSRVTCPNCGSKECMEENYYKRYEITMFCIDCGYSYLYNTYTQFNNYFIND